MPHLNVEITEEEIAAARDGARRSGMLLRFWVGRVLMAAAAAERSKYAPEPLPERTLERIDEQSEVHPI